MTYHFIGIGGIGMSAIARILLQKGQNVKGSDAHLSSLTDILQKEGAQIFLKAKAENITNGTVIYNSAISEENEEYAQAKKLGLPLLHRSEILDQLLCEKKALLVTGTHGKTSTSALLASVLIEAKLDPSFVIGGIVQSLQSNGKKGEGVYFVAEADESDGSFLKTAAMGAIVTNCDDDHLQYWKNIESLTQGFAQFFAQVTEKNHLFWCFDDPRLVSLHPPGFSYGFDVKADLVLSNYRSLPTGIVYDIEFQGVKYIDVECSLSGRHQALNSSAVFGLSLTLGIDPLVIRKALQTFQGVQRRLEKKGEARGVICFDDYGHHPVEIQATLKALKEKIGPKRLVVLFQPHRFSRLFSNWDGFISCFTAADLLFITDVYPAGEAPIEGISSQKLADAIGGNCVFVSQDKVLEEVAATLRPFDVLLTLGAGNITQMGPPILSLYEKKGKSLKVAVLYGGMSPEHEVSHLSQEGILQGLKSSLYTVQKFLIPKNGVWLDSEKIAALLACDIAIPVLHGPYGEDGMIQGFLETLQIPYVGCPYGAASVCMHKGWTKQIVEGAGIPIVPYVQILKSEYEKNPTHFLEEIHRKLKGPLWVKAVHLGSSIGVSRVVTQEELLRAIFYAFSVDDELLVETEIVGEQIEFAVLGNDEIAVGEPCRIVTQGEFYDYAKKYGQNPSPVEVPANISAQLKLEGIALAKRVYQALGCKGIARVDFFLDQEGYYWLNEVNPFPGFTVNSGYPKMWQAKEIEMDELVKTMIILGFERSRSVRAFS